MFRSIFIIWIMIGGHVSVSGADDGLNDRQRQAMVQMVNDFCPSASPTDVAATIERDVRSSPFITEARQWEQLDHTADLVGETAVAICTYARANDAENARVHLRLLLNTLVRAARLQTTPTLATLAHYGRCTLSTLAFGFAAAGMLFAEWSTRYDSMACSIAMCTSLGLSASWAPAWLWLQGDPSLAQNRTCRWLARRFDADPDWQAFWARVDTRLRRESTLGDVEIRGLDDLKRTIGRELRGISIEQACTSALLLEAPRLPETMEIQK